jgi:hypothetical protein
MNQIWSSNTERSSRNEMLKRELISVLKLTFTFINFFP